MAKKANTSQKLKSYSTQNINFPDDVNLNSMQSAENRNNSSNNKTVGKMTKKERRKAALRERNVNNGGFPSPLSNALYSSSSNSSLSSTSSISSVIHRPFCGDDVNPWKDNFLRSVISGKAR